MSKAGCCYLTASAHSQWWGAEGSRSKCQAKAPAILLLECVGAPSCPPWKFCLCGAVGFCTKSQADHPGLLAVSTPTCKAAPLRAPDLLHCHHTGHRSTFPPQREAELLHMRQSPSFCCSEDAGVPVPDEIRPVAASRETFQSLPCLRGTKFH